MSSRCYQDAHLHWPLNFSMEQWRKTNDSKTRILVMPICLRNHLIRDACSRVILCNRLFLFSPRVRHVSKICCLIAKGRTVSARDLWHAYESTMEIVTYVLMNFLKYKKNFSCSFRRPPILISVLNRSSLKNLEVFLATNYLIKLSIIGDWEREKKGEFHFSCQFIED